LDREALTVLEAWQMQSVRSAANPYVFSGVVETPSRDLRFRDRSHHFASRLVQSGVDLNTVRELLGHADLKMVLRYAHLAPGGLASAVEKVARGVDQKPSLAGTMNKAAA